MNSRHKHLAHEFAFIVVDQEGKLSKLEANLTLCHLLIFELIDDSLLLIEILHEVLAVPAVKLVSLSKLVHIVDVEVQNPQEVGVDLGFKVHIKLRCLYSDPI